MVNGGFDGTRVVLCPACGAEVTQAARFCSNCGARLAQPDGPAPQLAQSPPEPQCDRRPVTILFTDIVGSTSIAERLDPEEWREVVSGAHDRVSEAIVRYEGTIAQLLGDGVLAYFGAPAAHEDDPVRAVRAALDIQATIADYAHELAGYVDGFAMRIGVHTGEVVAGPVGGAGHVEYLAVGDAVNLAARLQSAANPGKVLLSASTARLVRGAFELTSLGMITVKGKSAPVAVYEVATVVPGVARRRWLFPTRADAPRNGETGRFGDAGTEDWRDAGAPTVTPLVGRAAELGVLTGVLESLCLGQGAIVVLQGEAGIGKSRLVEEAHAWATRHLCQPPRWLEGRALSYGSGLSYWTIGQLLKVDLGLSDGDSEIRARVALRRRLNGLPWEATKAAAAAPFLAHLLGLRLEDKAAEPLPALDSETLKYQLLVSIRCYFSALAEQQPLVLVGEDLHWADPSTLDALTELLPVTEHVPLLLLLVMRAEPEHGSWRLKRMAETDHSQRYTEIALRPLMEGEAQRLVDNLLPGESGLPESLRLLLLQRAEGNPFFLEELVANLVEQGVLVREGDVWHLNGPVESLSIPDTVQGVILARIDRLEADVRLTLQMASVIGRSFLYRLLQAIAETERQLDRHLGVLQRADLVREKALRPQLEYIFKHSLAQETTYHSLLLKRRREFHRRVGEALREMFAGREEEIYGLLAHHFDQASSAEQMKPADQAERAVHYLVAAGDKARMEDALAEAAHFYRRAVERLEGVGDAEGAARAWLKLALVYQADFDYAAAHEAYERGFVWQERAQPRPRRSRRSPDASAVLRRSTHCPVRRLDPGRFMLGHDTLLVQQLFAGLAEVDADLNVVPHAARSWEVLDHGCCFRIYLRDDVRWTDGSPVTAHDYAYAWRRMFDPRVPEEDYAGQLLEGLVGARAYRLGQLSDPAQVGIRALDDLTLEVRLEQPLPCFPYLLAERTTLPVPRQTVERWGDAWWQPEHIVSNGPFCLAHLEQERGVQSLNVLYSRVVLEHNPHYFGTGSGNLAGVEYLAIRDEAERLARFRTGELDLAACWEVPDDLADCCQDRQMLYTRWCLLPPQPPLDDVRVRRAIAVGVDWCRLAARMGASRATGGLIPSGMPGHSPGLGLSYSPEQGRRLLAEAGYPDGRGLPPLRLWCLMREVGAPAAQLLREGLSVEVDLQVVRPSTFYAGGGGAHLIFDGWQADLPDPDNFVRQSGILDNLRTAGWQAPELEASLERAAHTTDRAGRMALYRQVDRRLVAEEALVVPMAYGGGARELCQPWVHDARPNKMGTWSLKDAVVDTHSRH